MGKGRRLARGNEVSGRLRGIVGGFLVCALLCSTGLVRGAAKQEASRHFAHGMQLVEAGEVKNALDEFLRAYALMPHFAVLYNIGQAHAELGQPVQAVEAFRQYLAEGGTEVEPERRVAVEQIIRTLEASIGRIHVISPTGDGVLELDGAPAGALPLQQPIRVNPGVHQVSVRHPGRPVVSQAVIVAPGRLVEVALAAPTAETSGSTGRQTGQSPEPLSLAGLSGHSAHTRQLDSRAAPSRQGRLSDDWLAAQRPVAMGLGAAGMIGMTIGALYGLRALDREALSDELCAEGDGDPVSCSDTPAGRRGFRLNSEALDDTRRAWIAAAVGAALAAGGAALWLTAPSDASHHEQPLQAGIAIGGGFSGVVVRAVSR